jgi:hypothetical protein
MNTAATSTTPLADRTTTRFVGAVLLATATSSVIDAVIAAAAHAAGASHHFRPLTPTAFVPLTLIGVLAGAAGWQIVNRRAKDPRAVLIRLVPAVVVASLVPDIAVGTNGSQAGTSWTGVAALMVMHVAVAAVAVSVFRRLLS